MKTITNIILSLTSFALVFAANAYAGEKSTGGFYLGQTFVDRSGKDASAVEQINDNNFVSKTSKGLVIIDFYAPWCGPCKAFAPTFAKVAQQFQGTVAFYKMNTDESPKTAQNAKISSIPTVLLYRDGKLIDQNVGGFTEDGLKKFILSHK